MSNTTAVSRLESWGTIVTDAIGVFAAVWGVALGVLLVGLPIALLFALALRVARVLFTGL